MAVCAIEFFRAQKMRQFRQFQPENGLKTGTLAGRLHSEAAQSAIAIGMQKYKQKYDIFLGRICEEKRIKQNSKRSNAQTHTIGRVMNETPE
jgi:hypothetical protein